VKIFGFIKVRWKWIQIQLKYNTVFKTIPQPLRSHFTLAQGCVLWRFANKLQRMITPITFTVRASKSFSFQLQDWPTCVNTSYHGQLLHIIRHQNKVILSTSTNNRYHLIKLFPWHYESEHSVRSIISPKPSFFLNMWKWTYFWIRCLNVLPTSYR
jgi:hypothetical protein